MRQFLTNEVKWVEGMKWPPQCCVPAFFNAALIEQSFRFKAPQVLPSILDVKVLPDDYNPLGLSVADRIIDAGVTPSRAELKINQFLCEEKLPLKFFYVNLSEIVFELHDEFIKSALEQNISIGVGLDYGKISGEILPRLGRHVLRITGLSKTIVSLIDDSYEASISRIEVRIEDLLAAMRCVDGGYWVMGPQNLQIQHYNSVFN